MDIRISDKQAKALKILTEHPGLSAMKFAAYYFDKPEQEYLFTVVSNQGNGACAGKKAWLCAGSMLGKLRKKQLVGIDHYDVSSKYFVTARGRKALAEFTSASKQ